MELQGADILMVNNEYAYSDRGYPLPGKTYTFRAMPTRVPVSYTHLDVYKRQIEGGRVNMCKAIDDLILKGKLEGRVEGVRKEL